MYEKYCRELSSLLEVDRSVVPLGVYVAKVTRVVKGLLGSGGSRGYS